jgi:hypothetical protein
MLRHFDRAYSELFDELRAGPIEGRTPLFPLLYSLTVEGAFPRMWEASMCRVCPTSSSIPSLQDRHLRPMDSPDRLFLTR